MYVCMSVCYGELSMPSTRDTALSSPLDYAAVSSALPDWFWRRHANPKSGWSRLLATPLLLLAVSRRDRRLLVLALVYTLLNPVAFPPPADDRAWMTRGVLGERVWIEHGPRPRWVSALNAVSGLPFLYALVAAYRRQPGCAAVAATLAGALKMAFVAWCVRLYDRTREEHPDADLGLSGR